MKVESKFKNELLNTLMTMNNLLTKHIEIHDSIFNPPKRAAIPIPFIFKKIDFKKLHENGQKNKEVLEQYLDSLMDISQEGTDLDRELSGGIRGYANRFLASVIKLNEIAEELYLKSENNNRFTYDEYNLLVDDYKQIEKRRIEMSGEINEIVRRLDV